MHLHQNHLLSINSSFMVWEFRIFRLSLYKSSQACDLLHSPCKCKL
jgi:hypothetical protein